MRINQNCTETYILQFLGVSKDKTVQGNYFEGTHYLLVLLSSTSGNCLVICPMKPYARRVSIIIETKMKGPLCRPNSGFCSGLWPLAVGLLCSLGKTNTLTEDFWHFSFSIVIIGTT